ncbi:MAG TPA: class I SAM-dependent methyltransferase [Bryobacteraceae bacterium]|jgi:hypothetical protein|nr:class I SAM-dependent methyltransferase [Bryobacteraceae bacterium]
MNALELVRDIEERGWTMESPAGLTGYSGRKILNLLQHLVQSCRGENCYAEVGVFQGLTLLSVAAANPVLACFGIDNFSFGDGAGNRRKVETACDSYGLMNAHLVVQGYEEAMAQLAALTGGRKIAVYFVDGPHDYRSQLMCLLLARPHLAPGVVIVIDDCNYPQVRQANRDFLVTHPDYALAFQAYTPRHPNNMDAQGMAAASAGWWNGINLIVHDPDRLLVRRYPPLTEAASAFQREEHWLHSTAMRALARPLFAFCEALTHPHMLRNLAGTTRLLWRALHTTPSPPHRTMNTYSENLPAIDFADLR